MAIKEIHWADLAADNLIKANNKASYVCASGITPSGTVHIGNFREVLTTDLIVKALEKKGKKVRFIYSWDDYDTFRKVPANMPNQDMLNKYMGQPIVDIKDPFDCNHTSYAEHHEKEFEEYLPTVFIHPEFLYQAQKYRKCEYAELIKKALQNKEKIAEILNKYREEPLAKNWYPTTIFCSKCNIDDTEIIEYDNEYDITYKCTKCNNEETFDIRKKGIIKLLWRVDWPSRWHFEKVDFEPGGKDHSTIGGSYTTGCDIIKEIYHEEPPQYIMYDFISIKGTGGKISSSKGNVITLKELLEIYEPEIIRWIFASTRPNTEFAISFDLDVITMYEDFDRNERLYFGNEKTDISEELLDKEKRIYELSCVNIQKQQPLQIGFRHLTTISQVHELNVSKILEQFKDQIKNPFDKKRIETRTKCVINWLNEYAPEDFKFRVNSVAPKIELKENDKVAITSLINVLETKELTDEQLHQEFYEIMQKTKHNMKEFFGLFYKIIISKERGPKLASFILTIGKPRILKLLKESIKN